MEEFLVTIQTKVRAEDDTEALLKGLKKIQTPASYLFLGTLNIKCEKIYKD